MAAYRRALRSLNVGFSDSETLFGHWHATAAFNGSINIEVRKILGRARSLSFGEEALSLIFHDRPIDAQHDPLRRVPMGYVRTHQRPAALQRRDRIGRGHIRQSKVVQLFCIRHLLISERQVGPLRISLFRSKDHESCRIATCAGGSRCKSALAFKLHFFCLEELARRYNSTAYGSQGCERLKDWSKPQNNSLGHFRSSTLPFKNRRGFQSFESRHEKISPAQPSGASDLIAAWAQGLAA